MEGLARTMIGATGADLANLVNTAALRASMQRKQAVRQEELEWALDRIVLGNDRRDIRTPDEMRLTAFHEGGHALIAMLTEGAGPIHKATILPRGKALGVVRGGRRRGRPPPTTSPPSPPTPRSFASRPRRRRRAARSWWHPWT